jgi:hypothetical protein
LKHDELRAIAHNVAASVSEVSFLVGVYDTRIGEGLSNTPAGVITADFLQGTVDPPVPRAPFALAVSLVPAVLPDLCASHRVPVSAFRELRARYTIGIEGLRTTVIVVDAQGRRSETEYGGHSSQRVKTLDSLGRLRQKSVKTSKA